MKSLYLAPFASLFLACVGTVDFDDRRAPPEQVTSGGDSKAKEQVAPSPPPGPAPDPKDYVDGDLVTGLTTPHLLALDAHNVYFGAEKMVLKCARTGCNGEPTILGSVTRHIGAIVSDGLDVYWTDGAGDISACAVRGCDRPRVVVSGLNIPHGLTQDATSLYWVEFGGSVKRCAKSACVPETIAVNESRDLWGITIQGTDLYWSADAPYVNSDTNGVVRTCSLAGPCVPRTLVLQQNGARTLAVHGRTLAWIADGMSSVFTCTLPSCRDVSKMTMAGQTGLAMDDERIYWSHASSGVIQTCGRSSCTGATEVVSEQKPTDLAVDATHLYWISTDVADSRGGQAGTGKLVARRTH